VFNLSDFTTNISVLKRRQARNSHLRLIRIFA